MVGTTDTIDTTDTNDTIDTTDTTDTNDATDSYVLLDTSCITRQLISCKINAFYNLLLDKVTNIQT
jgi:hypothetical protein